MAGLRSFVGEARLLAQFDHPSLVKVFRFWEANSTAYMVMPLYSGMTFKQARAQMRTPPPEAWLRKVLWSVLGALRVLHGGQTLHRDVSPDNIFLQDVGPPVLLDLGAARHAINDRDRKHTAVLKVNYAPIEQYADGDAELAQGPWSDLYSLAAVVHGCLCNDTPLPSTLRSIRDRMVPFARVAKTVRKQFGQEYSPAFVAAISQALALRPEDRPQSIDAFLQAMAMTVPPAALADWTLLSTAMLAGVVTFCWHGIIERLRNPVLMFDAAGLALFAVLGTGKALAFGLSPFAATLLGIITGIGGGIARDLLVVRTPVVLQQTELYAVAALAGGGIVAIAHALGWPQAPAMVVGALLCFSLRFMAIRRGWRLPVARDADQA